MGFGRGCYGSGDVVGRLFTRYGYRRGGLLRLGFAYTLGATRHGTGKSCITSRSSYNLIHINEAIEARFSTPIHPEP